MDRSVSSQEPVLYVHLGYLLMRGFSDRNFQTAVNSKAITLCLNWYSTTNSALRHFHFKKWQLPHCARKAFGFLNVWALHPGHYLLFAPVKIPHTKHSWKLKLLGHVWKPGQVEWCHFTTNRCIHAANKGSLNLCVHWGHQPFWTVTFRQSQDRQNELIISNFLKILQKMQLFLPNPFCL